MQGAQSPDAASHRQPHGAASRTQAGLCRAPPAASASAPHPSSSPAEQAADPCGSVLRINHEDDLGRGGRSQVPCPAWAGGHPLLPECTKLGSSAKPPPGEAAEAASHAD